MYATWSRISVKGSCSIGVDLAPVNGKNKEPGVNRYVLGYVYNYTSVHLGAE